MNIAEKKQRRLRHLIDAPKRFLRRARDLYVDSLVSIDSKVGSANIMSNASHNLAKNYGRCSSSSSSSDEENLEEMYRSICNRYGVEFGRGAGSLRERGGIDRSYSIALGKMGTIDEEEPCEFEEKSDIFLRSRSHAVTRSYYAFH